VHAVPDLVQPHQLVLDQAVVELEEPGAGEQSAGEGAAVECPFPA
jgi:hypothetical protein